MISLGNIGCGWIAEKAYLPLITKMNDVDVCAVFDIDNQKAHGIQKQYCVPNVFDNIDSFLSIDNQQEFFNLQMAFILSMLLNSSTSQFN